MKLHILIVKSIVLNDSSFNNDKLVQTYLFINGLLIN